MKTSIHKKITAFVSLSIILAWSCSGKKDIVITNNENRTEVNFSRENIESTKDLIGEKINYQELISKPRAILVKKQHLLIADTHPEKMIHVIDLKDPAKYGIRGVKGYGPNEIMTSSSLDAGFNDSTFWSYSVNQRMWSEFDLYRDQPLAVKQLSFNNVETTASLPIWTYTKSVMTLNVDGKSKYTEMDTSGNTLNLYGDWSIDYPNQVPDYIRSSIFFGKFKANQAKDDFIIGSLYVDVLNILDLKSRRITTIQGPDHIEPTYNLIQAGGYPVFSPDAQKSHYAYIDVYSGKTHYYGLYSGSQWNGAMQDKNACTEIIMIDKKTFVPKILKLDYPITRFTIDEENSTIYAIAYDADNSILKFSL